MSASDGSEAARAWIETGFVGLSRLRIVDERDLNSTSRDIWVIPLCDFDPNMVCVCRTTPLACGFFQAFEIDVIYAQTFPLPETPSVATTPSLPSAKTPFINESIPVSSKMSNCFVCSSNTFVKANFSTALFLDSFGGWTVIRVGHFSALLESSVFAGSTVRYVSDFGACDPAFSFIGGRSLRYIWKRDVCPWAGFEDFSMAVLSSSCYHLNYVINEAQIVLHHKKNVAMRLDVRLGSLAVVRLVVASVYICVAGVTHINPDLPIFAV